MISIYLDAFALFRGFRFNYIWSRRFRLYFNFFRLISIYFKYFIEISFDYFEINILFLYKFRLFSITFDFISMLSIYFDSFDFCFARFDDISMTSIDSIYLAALDAFDLIRVTSKLYKSIDNQWAVDTLWVALQQWTLEFLKQLIKVN